MTSRSLLFLLALSLFIGSVIELAKISKYESELKAVTESVCDVVQLRAQDGSTRDVYDQVFSFIRKHAPDKSGFVRLQNGGSEIGSNSSETRNSDQLEIACEIANRPDYHIVASFHRHQLFSSSLAVGTSLIFLLLAAASSALTYIFARAKIAWSEQIICDVRAELGLTVFEPRRSAFYRSVVRTVFAPFGSLKVDIAALRRDIESQKDKLISSQQQIDSERLASDRARAFEEKVRMVQHDLKTPLSVLKVLAHSESSDSELLPHAIRSVERIVGDLTKATDADQREGMNDTRLEILEVAVNEAILDKKLTSSKPLEIEFDYDELKLNLVEVNPNFLKRSIMNLIQNAIDARSEGLRIVVKIRRAGEHVEIEIADNGPGLPIDLAAAIFEKEKTFGKSHGSGLGLYFAKTCFEAWHGSIEVSSSTMTGATFLMKLPARESSVLFQDANCARSASHLVVVDDEVEFQKQYWLASGREVIFFSSPLLFMSWFEIQPDCDTYTLVIDLHLRSAVDGLDVIRTLGPRSQTFLSSSDYLNQDAIVLASSHGYAIIPKPLFISQI